MRRLRGRSSTDSAFHLPDVPSEGLSLEAVLAAAGAGGPGGPRLLRVRKQRARYTVGGCQAERSVFEVDGRRATSIAIESTDPAAVVAAVDALGLSAYVNQDVRTGLRLLVDGVPERYAVIDAGTNSTKFHLAELDLDGSWRTVVDRAVVTRLGEGLEATGEIGAVPLDRTAQAIGEMADEARSLDVRGIAVVGTAGLRIASNQAEVVETLRARTGLSLEVISGEDEGRLAHLAVATGVGLDDGAIVVFDTGGGSSQFTFGHGPVVDERFSLDVGAVRFTEQFGLAEAVSADVVADAVAAIAAELGRLDGRRAPAGCRGDGRRRHEPRSGEARPDHLRPGRRPGDGPGPRRDRPPDRALPQPGTPLGGGRSPGCSRPAPR